MKAFEYASPTSVDDALKLLGGPGSAEALSGGTDLIGRMKDYVTSPDRVVYLKDVKDLAGISWDSNVGLTIGAGTTLAEVLAHQGIKDHLPALREAAEQVGTPQIKNMATVGGNLLQRPRCWYYRSGFGLLALKDGKSMVRDGDNRYHAIFMTDGDALYVNPSSLAAPLVALGAKATIASPRGERTVAVEDLYRLPKREGDRELSVAPGEVLTKVLIPRGAGRNATYEARHKQAHDWPLVMASVNLPGEGAAAVGDGARVVIYGVAPIPWRSEAAEKAIAGKTIDDVTATAAAEAAVEGAKPLSMNGYKVALTKTCVRRALMAAVGNRYWEA
jgi:xanthine dehydrogenase YagS FAD-binding subunit